MASKKYMLLLEDSKDHFTVVFRSKQSSPDRIQISLVGSKKEVKQVKKEISKEFPEENYIIVKRIK